METTNLHSGEKIKKIRIAQNLTQEQLGRLCVPPMAGSAIRRYESGKASPKIQTLQRIAKALKIPVDEIRSDIDLDCERMMNLVKNMSLPLNPESISISGQKGHVQKLAASFSKLNDKGQEKAASYVDDLSKIPEYKKE